MKSQNKNSKSAFFKKIFIKICRFFNFEIIDQSNLYLPVANKFINEELSVIGEKSLTIPMGTISIKRPVKSLNIIFVLSVEFFCRDILVLMRINLNTL